MENNFKEFWIVPEIAEISYEPTNTYPHNVYHVIEYAAIESANAEIKKLKDEIKQLLKEKLK
jgi:hypothetical protein